MKTSIHPLVSRSLTVAGLACALSTIPLAAVHAQTAPTSPGQVDTTQQDPTNAKSTAPSSGEPVTKSADKLTAKEKQFINKAGAGNAAEVQLAQLALKNGESQAVKDFAQKMITDHTAANEELDAIAKSHGVANFNPMPKEEDKALYAKMTEEKGTAFDTAYAKHAVVDHEADLREYKMADKSVKDKDLLEYAEKTTKVVEEHLKMAKELESTKSAAANH